MKTKLFAVMAFLLCLVAQAQSSTPVLTFNPAQSKPGQPLQLTYNASNTPLAQSSEITALVYAYDQEKAKVQEVPLTKGKKGWVGKFTLAPEAAGALILFRDEENTDTNHEKGYVVLGHDGKKKIMPGAHAGLAAAYVDWGGMVGIERDPAKALKLLEQELALYPESQRKMTQTRIYALLSAFKGEEMKTKVASELDALAQEPNLSMKELTLLANFYGRFGQKEKAEKYANMLRVKEPASEFVQSERLSAYFEEKDADKKQELLLAFAADFPAHKYVPNLLSSTAVSYATEGKWQEFDAFLTRYPQLATSSTYNSAAWKLYEAGEHLAKAKELAEKGFRLAKENVTQPITPKDDLTAPSDYEKQRKYSLGQVADTYGAILLKEGSPAAERYLAVGYLNTRGRSTGINERYAQVISQGTDKAKAQKVLEEMVAGGNASGKIKDHLKEVYTHTNKGEAGFDAYYAKVEAPALEKMRSSLKKKLISEKAPAFELVDLNGKAVSLASMKGKTVVVDFWATWCGPCIASFPSMKQAVNSYKDNDKVAFVFVNSWENGEDKKKSVTDFINKKSYTFQVLMDEENKMIEAYKVSGIPTKFILDGDGNIRFKSVGFSGNAEKSLQELSMMIDLLKPDLLTSTK